MSKLTLGQRVLTLYGEGTIVEVHANNEYGVADDEYNMVELYDRSELAELRRWCHVWGKRHSNSKP